MRRSAKLAVLGLVGVFGVLAAAPALQAANEPANVYEYRKKLMTSLAAHLGSIGHVVKGEVDYKDHVAGHAHAIAESAKFILQVFPEGTGIEALPDSRALPKIWQDWAKFEAQAKVLQEEAAKLAEVAMSGDAQALAEQFAKTGKQGCGGCHEDFRKPKDQ